MKINPTKNIKKYIENKNTVPLVRIKNTLWYSITQEEKESLVQFINALDAITSKEWNALPEDKQWELSCAWNDANCILRNSVLRDSHPLEATKC